MLNRRQAITAAFGFAASAGLPKPASMADQIADVFGIPRQMLPPVPILYGHVDSFWFDESILTKALADIQTQLDESQAAAMSLGFPARTLPKPSEQTQ